MSFKCFQKCIKCSHFYPLAIGCIPILKLWHILIESMSRFYFFIFKCLNMYLNKRANQTFSTLFIGPFSFFNVLTMQMLAVMLAIITSNMHVCACGCSMSVFQNSSETQLFPFFSLFWLYFVHTHNSICHNPSLSLNEQVKCQKCTYIEHLAQNVKVFLGCL